MKALVIAIALLFITNSLYSQKVLNSVAGRDYRHYGFVQNYLRADKIDTFLIISDDYNNNIGYCSSLIYSLNNLKFIKRTDLLFMNKINSKNYSLLGYSENNGGEFWYKNVSNDYTQIEKQKIFNENNQLTRKIVKFKDSLFEVDGKNTKESFMINDTIYFNSKNLNAPTDTSYYITAWNVKNISRIKDVNKYFNKTNTLPIKDLKNNYYIIDDETIYNENTNSKKNVFDEIEKYNKEIVRTYHAENENINNLGDSKYFIAFYQNMALLNNNNSYYSHIAFIIDSNLQIVNHLLTKTIIRSDSYNSNNNILYFIDSSNKLNSYNIKTNKINKTVVLEDYLPINKIMDIHNVTVLNDSIVMFTLHNESQYGGIHSSFLFNVVSNKIMKNIYNDLYFVQNISISDNDKYISVLGKNKKLYIYDSNLVELFYYDFSQSINIDKNDTNMLTSEMLFNITSNKLFISASNLLRYNMVVDLLNFQIEKVFTNNENSYTAAWNSNNKYLAMNNGSNIIELYNASNNFQFIRKIELSGNYKISKIMFKSSDTLNILVKDTISKNDIIISWNCPTYDYTEFKTNQNIFKVNNINSNTNIKVNKNNNKYYQDYDGKYRSINTQSLIVNYFDITGIKYDYIPQYNYSLLTGSDRFLFYSNNHIEDSKNIDSYLSIIDVENQKQINYEKINYNNDRSSFRVGGDAQFTTRQFCNYAQFNNNPNKIICGSFDGTLSILEFDNLLTSVEAENINSLDKTSKVLVTGKSYEFRNNESYPVKLSVYNFNGISVSELILETSELIDLAKYSNNEKMLLIQRENNQTGEVIDNKILIFQ